jgi:hypothetical protein
MTERPVEDGPDAARQVRQHIESDFRIRSGLCPNGCGLLGPLIAAPDPAWQGQECQACHFSTNVLAEKGSAQ